MLKDTPKLIVTPYMNPDLDGSACAYGYAELLCKEGKQAIAAIFGEPNLETQFVFEKFSINNPTNGDEVIKDADEIIIVDASDTKGLSDKINPQKVIEVIDHRKLNDAHLFPNAKVQIEMVGSAATLIAEKFRDSGVTISFQAAALLYSAIVSNTVNFKAAVTTNRDSKMAEWCLGHFVLPENYISEMFTAKSKIDQPLEDILMFAKFTLNGYNIAIAQLEMVDVESLISTNLPEIKKILDTVKKDDSMDIVLLTCIDVSEGFNLFVACDEFTKTCLQKALGVKFIDNVAKKSDILMRKEIVPLIEQSLQK